MHRVLGRHDPTSDGRPRPAPGRSLAGRIVGWAAVGLCALALALAALPGPVAIADDDAELDQRIADLIKQLGDNEYVVRSRAQRELARLGFAAFDALTEAEENEDVEIATQARYLARQIRSEWIETSDSPQVRAILKDYDSQDDRSRRIRMQQLLQLPDDAGIEGLCRLLRFFEQSPLLTKQGAMLIITQDPQPDDANWPKRAAILAKNLDRSRRPASRLLRTYVEMRTDPEKSLPHWAELIEAEKRTLEQHPQQSDSHLLMQLLQIKVAQLQRLERDDEALAAMHEMVGIERGDPVTLAELVGWLAKRRAWSVIDEVATRFAASFEADPRLLYVLAQALAAEGKTDKAQQAADRALALNPDRAADHLDLGLILQHRGLMDWSDREYRHVIEMKGPPLDSQVIGLAARLRLADNLHDRGLDGQAGEVMQGAVTALESNKDLRRRALEALHLDTEHCLARANFYLACEASQRQDFARQRELLESAIQEDPNDGDVLIALYRLPNPTAEQRQKTLELIASAIQLSRNQIDEDADKSNPYNQLAWLVANTEGDFDEAVRLSEKSVELERTALSREIQGKGDVWVLDREERLGGHLDTLAHCYAAKGDYAAAIKAQAAANRLLPYSQTIANKLAFFRGKLSPAGGGDAP